MYSGNVTLGYLLARPNEKMPKNTPPRICVIYIRDANDTLYSWTVDRRSCVRNIHPGVAGVYKFNTTKLGNNLYINSFLPNIIVSLQCINFYSFFKIFLSFSESCGAFSMLLKTASIMIYLPFVSAFLWLSSFIHTPRLIVNGFL